MNVAEIIKELIKNAIVEAQKAGELSTRDIPIIHLEIPKNPKHGDFSTNIAFKL